MRDGKIAVEIDLKKIGAVALMVIATWLGVKCGEGETLMIIIPACLAYVTGKRVAGNDRQ